MWGEELELMEVSLSVNSFSEGNSLTFTADTVEWESSIPSVESPLDSGGWLGEFCEELSTEGVSFWGKDEKSCDEEGDPSSEFGDSGED